MIVICNLDKDVRLAATDNAYVLQVEESGVWVDKYSYTWIGDAIKGYILYSLKRMSKAISWSGTKDLVDKIDALDISIKSVDKRLVSVAKILENDPIESEIVRGKRNVR